jgi:hypothetical protein
MTKILTLMSGFGLGALFATTITLAGAAENATKPAYMIVSSQRIPGADYGPYSAAAGPLARDAGLQMIASSKEPVVLEGSWPHKNVTL